MTTASREPAPAGQATLTWRRSSSSPSAAITARSPERPASRPSSEAAVGTESATSPSSHGALVEPLHDEEHLQALADVVGHPARVAPPPGGRSSAA